MSTQEDKLSAKLDELAQRASQGTEAMDAMVARANDRTHDIHDRARTALEKAGRQLRESANQHARDAAERHARGAADRRMRAQDERTGS